VKERLAILEPIPCLRDCEITLALGTDGLPSVGECLKAATLKQAHSQGRAIASDKSSYFTVSSVGECLKTATFKTSL